MVMKKEHIMNEYQNAIASYEEFDAEKCRRFAADIRINTIRQMATFGAGHIGGSASIADAMAVLYGGLMRINPAEPRWDGRDYLVMSKGHCGPALYSALALKGFFPMEWLGTLNKIGTNLPSHCDRNHTPGIDASTGSLGQGISLAVGFAQAAKMKKNPRMVYTIVGDGEIQEGQVWEAAEFAATRNLNNLVVLVDENGAQLDGYTDDICKSLDIRAKFESFGFNAVNVKGDDVNEVAKVLYGIRDAQDKGDKPYAVILKTKKGAGVLFAERKFPNHHLNVNVQDAEEAIAEVERRLNAGLLPGGEAR